MKNTYVLEKKTLKMENEIVALKNIVRSAIEIEDKGIQKEGHALETEDMIGQAMELDKEEFDSIKETRIKTINNLLTHKVNALKLVSQNMYSSYLIL